MEVAEATAALLYLEVEQKYKVYANVCWGRLGKDHHAAFRICSFKLRGDLACDDL